MTWKGNSPVESHPLLCGEGGAEVGAVCRVQRRIFEASGPIQVRLVFSSVSLRSGGHQRSARALFRYFGRTHRTCRSLFINFVPRERMCTENTATGLLSRQITIDGVLFRYALLVPHDYNDGASGAFPLVVFLNGAGECGEDGTKQCSVGLGPAALGSPGRWRCLVLFPQKPSVRVKWVAFEPLVLGTIEATTAEYTKIDRRRVSLTGLSQGGNGALEIAARHPGVFSCVAPCVGSATRGSSPGRFPRFRCGRSTERLTMSSPSQDQSPSSRQSARPAESRPG